jgi:hypothetical protein
MKDENLTFFDCEKKINIHDKRNQQIVMEEV